MVIKLSIGSKCALMLPREFVNFHLTPAKGLIINKLVDQRSLVLIEEVWQFYGLEGSPLQDKVTKSGSLRHDKWGWQEVPRLVGKDDYLIIPAFPHNLMEAGIKTLDAMIKKSVADFKAVNNIM